MSGCYLQKERPRLSRMTSICVQAHGVLKEVRSRQSVEQTQMLNENRAANSDKHYASRDLRSFANFCARGRPSSMPLAAISVVAAPIASAVTTMFTCRNAIPTPTAMASRLVAMVVVTRSQNGAE